MPLQWLSSQNMRHSRMALGEQILISGTWNSTINLDRAITYDQSRHSHPMLGIISHKILQHVEIWNYTSGLVIVSICVPRDLVFSAHWKARKHLSSQMWFFPFAYQIGNMVNVLTLNQNVWELLPKNQQVLVIYQLLCVPKVPFLFDAIFEGIC